ncbi:MAG TPA: cytosolic protein [Dehalococcoidia bacterium]|nr:cytosolic protein [Dehalococcoidia bacterium]
MKEERYKLDEQELVDLIFDSLHLIALHYGTWFWETEHQLGLDKAIEVDDIAWRKVLPIMLERVASRFKVPTKDGVPRFLTEAAKEELVELLVDMAKNWLASDGVWFQVVEQNFDYEMYNAKRINDSCWAKFAYIEAKRIRKRLNLPDGGGLPALKEALGYRQYALINRQEIVEVSPNKLIFRMNECRVQSARKRAGLPDYPCKSAGVVEYTRFAEGIDPRIKTTCLGCPPDPHPEEWYCAWEFTI